MTTLARAPHPYATFVHKVDKPARYLGGEYGSATRDWDIGPDGHPPARVCLAFPDIYDIGMSHLGFKILYKILNDDPRTLAERAFVPWVDMDRELRARGLPLLSLESARPLKDFDVVGVSLQFELTYTNILTLLELGGIPLTTAERADGDPLVLAGGPSATHSEPIATILDAIVIGDGEERMTEVALLWTQLKREGKPRNERLRALAGLRGVYVPSLYETEVEPQTGFLVVKRPSDPSLPFPIVRTLVGDLNKYPFPATGPVGGPEAIFERMSIEIARGCTEGCRFCQAGMIYRPVRERDPDQIVETVLEAVKKSGYDEVSLTSLSTADYSCIAPLVKKVVDKLAPEKVSLGVSSLRAYGLEENVLDDMQRVRASGVTFAPEAGSQRMRDVVNKNVTEEQLHETADRVFSRGWNDMKLYFMIGLPTEEESDVREIVRVGKRTREIGRAAKARINHPGTPTVTVSVSTHVPKPHTPFQWAAMDTYDTVVEKQKWLREEARLARGVELKTHDSRTSWLEAVYARGDRRLSDVLVTAYKNGARFDSWDDHLKLSIWEEAFRIHGIDPQVWLGTLPVTARLSWDHIDVGLEEGFLLSEYRKALKSRLSPPCGKVAGMFVQHTNLQDAEADTRRLVCYDCGVACDLSAMKNERLVYLKKLGAEAPRAPAPLPVVQPKRQHKAPASFVQGEARRYRFLYEKSGPSAFLGHLDVIRALPRTFRRIDVPMYYTHGFHPKPDMVFGPALSLGVASLCEAVDLKLTADVDPDAIAAELTAASAEGIRFFAAAKLDAEDPPLSKVVDSAEYLFAIPRSFLGDAPVDAALAHFAAREHAYLVRGGDEAGGSGKPGKFAGIGKKLDVKRYVHRLERMPEDAARAIFSKAGLVGDFHAIHLAIGTDQNGSAKLTEVLSVLFERPEAEIPWQAVRTALGARLDDGTLAPLTDLSTMRACAAAKKAQAERDAAAAKVAHDAALVAGELAALTS
jgi:radical SAM family uncharacterized protein/radical SAM-linked protein